MRYLLVMKAHGLANEIAKGSVGLQNYLDKLSRRIDREHKKKKTCFEKYTGSG